MLIIVEGADGAGKSTVIQQITHALNDLYPLDTVEVKHAKPPKNHPLTEYEVPLFGYRPGRGHHVICDRWHIGEWVYPNVFDRPTLTDRASWIHIHMFLASRGAIVVHVDPGDEIIAHRVNVRGDDMVSAEQSKIAAQLYRSIMPTIPMIDTIYTTGLDNDFDVSKIVASGQNAENKISRLQRYLSYVGPQKPEFVLLASTHDQVINRPALMPYCNTSGNFILEHIPMMLDTICGVMYWSDSDDLEDINFTLNYPKIIALGKTAWNKLKHLSGNDNTYGIAHPYHVYRLRMCLGYDYWRAIQHVLTHDASEHSRWIELPGEDSYEND